MAFSFAAGDAELRIKLDIDLCDPSEKRRRRAPSIAASLVSSSSHEFKSNADYAAELKAQDDADARKRSMLLKETQDFMAYLQNKYNLNPSQPEQILLGKVVPRLENNGALNPKIDGLSAVVSGSTLKGYTVPFDSKSGSSASSRTVFENGAGSQRPATAKPPASSSSNTTNSGFTPLPYEPTTSNSRMSVLSMSSSELNRVRKPVNTATPALQSNADTAPKSPGPWKFAHNFTKIADAPPEAASFRSHSSPLPQIRKAYTGMPPASGSASSSSVGTSKSSLNLTSTSDLYKGITPGVTAKQSSSTTSMASTQSASSGASGATFPTASFSIPNGIESNNQSPVATTLSATTYASLPTGATMSASQRSGATSPSSSQVFPNAKVTIPEGLAINECEIHVVAQSPASKSAVLTDNTQSETNTATRKMMNSMKSLFSGGKQPRQ